MNNGLKINLGCGTDIKPGWVNVDIAKLDGVDIVHDLDELPLPSYPMVCEFVGSNSTIF